MKINRFFPVAYFCLFFFISHSAGAADNYIKITRDRIDIYASPQTSAVVVCQSRKGDVFKLVGQRGYWFTIEMFSGRERYVLKSKAEITRPRISLPPDTYKQRAIFLNLFQAENQARDDAFQRNQLGEKGEFDNDLFDLLVDRYALEVMHRFSVQPPVYGLIKKAGVK